MHALPPSHPPTCTCTCTCRRPGDEHLKPNQKLNVMLQRILRADYTFPPNKNLRCACRRCRCCCRQLSWPRCWLAPSTGRLAPCPIGRAAPRRAAPGPPASCFCSEGVRDLISRILVQDPNLRPSLQVGDPHHAAVAYSMAAGLFESQPVCIPHVCPHLPCCCLPEPPWAALY
jgi:hypothetical protein